MSLQINKNPVNIRESLSKTDNLGDMAYQDKSDYVSSAGYTGKNLLINGDLSVWQRGTSFTSHSSYAADRWMCWAAWGAQNWDRVDAGLDGFQYAIKGTIATSVADNRQGVLLKQESKIGVSLRGKTATFSFYIKGDATSTFIPNLNFYYSTTDGGTINTFGATTTLTQVTTSWVRQEWTITFPSTCFNFYISMFATATQATGSEVYFTGLQLELGSVATDFEIVPPAIQLANCKRYYQKSYQDSDAVGTDTITGLIGFRPGATDTNHKIMQYTFPVVMRAPPSMLLRSKTGQVNAVSNWDNHAMQLGGSIMAITDKGFQIGAQSSTTNAGFVAHFSADAEL